MDQPREVARRSQTGIRRISGISEQPNILIQSGLHTEFRTRNDQCRSELNVFPQDGLPDADSASGQAQQGEKPGQAMPGVGRTSYIIM
jgi:hypothetical protein